MSTRRGPADTSRSEFHARAGEMRVSRDLSVRSHREGGTPGLERRWSRGMAAKSAHSLCENPCAIEQPHGTIRARRSQFRTRACCIHGLQVGTVSNRSSIIDGESVGRDGCGVVPGSRLMDDHESSSRRPRRSDNWRCTPVLCGPDLLRGESLEAGPQDGAAPGDSRAGVPSGLDGGYATGRAFTIDDLDAE